MNGLKAFRRELEVFVDEATNEKRRLEIFISVSRKVVDQFTDEWKAATAGAAQVDVLVNGEPGRVEEARLGGTIVARARTLGIVATRALELYDTFVKVVTGDLKQQLAVFVGGGELEGEPMNIKQGSEVVITNLAPFSRKAEMRAYNDTDESGFSDGLFEAVASILRREIEGMAEVVFEWREVGSGRVPCIVIR